MDAPGTQLLWALCPARCPRASALLGWHPCPDAPVAASSCHGLYLSSSLAALATSHLWAASLPVRSSGRFLATLITLHPEASNAWLRKAAAQGYAQ